LISPSLFSIKKHATNTASAYFSTMMSWCFGLPQLKHFQVFLQAWLPKYCLCSCYTLLLCTEYHKPNTNPIFASWCPNNFYSWYTITWKCTKSIYLIFILSFNTAYFCKISVALGVFSTILEVNWWLHYHLYWSLAKLNKFESLKSSPKFNGVDEWCMLAPLTKTWKPIHHLFLNIHQSKPSILYSIIDQYSIYLEFAHRFVNTKSFYSFVKLVDPHFLCGS
jgi:hypothetical protein